MKKTIAVLLLFITLGVICGSYAYATDSITMPAYSESNHSSGESDLIAPEESDDVLPLAEILKEGKWACSGTAASSYTVSSIKATYFCADIDRDYIGYSPSGAVTFTFDFSDTELDITDYSSIRFAASVRGGEASGKGFFTRISVATGENTKVAHVYLEGTDDVSALSLVGTDVSSLGGKLESIRITVYFTDEKMPDHVRVSAPYLMKTNEFSASEKYITTGFDTSVGSFDEISGTITPDDGGDAVLSAFYAGGFVNYNGKSYFIVSVNGADSGSLCVDLRYYDSDSNNISEITSQRVSLSKKCRQYVFPFDINGAVLSYSLRFSAISSDGDVTLDGVEMCEGSAGIHVESGLGSISKIERNGDSVRFEGTLSRAAAKEYSRAKIGFYAVSSGYIRDAVLLGSIDITTKFEYTVPLDGQPVSHDASMYMAAIVTDRGDVLPIAAPRYCDAKAETRSDGIKLGFADTQAVSAFESNASHIIIDIALDELLYTEGKTTVTLPYTVYGVEDEDKNYSSRSTLLDKKLIDEVEDEINFCISAGMKVYLRFTSTVPIDGLTYTSDGAENYAPMIDSAEGKYLYAAIVKFFSRRNPGIDGFVIGVDATSERATGAEIVKALVKYADNLAEVCRLTYNAALTYIDSPAVIIPVSDNGEYSPSVISVMLADMLDVMGPMPIAVMYCEDSFGGAAAVINTIKSVAELGYSCDFYPMLLCCADEDELLREYAEEYGTDAEKTFAEYSADRIEEYCENSGSARAVFVSLGTGALGTNRDVYSALKLSNRKGTVIEAYACEGAAETSEEYEVWNFTDKHYALGWRAIGVRTLLSDYSKQGADRSDRCLAASFEGKESGTAGILLCNFEKTVDLTKADSMNITLSAQADDFDGCIDLVFILGTGDCRAEYGVSVPTDGVRRTLMCDLTKYSERNEVDYTGVMVYHDTGVELEIEKITVSGDGADYEELKSLFSAETEQGEKERDKAFVYTVAGIMILATLAIFIMILKHEHDIKEEAADSASLRRETVR